MCTLKSLCSTLRNLISIIQPLIDDDGKYQKHNQFTTYSLPGSYEIKNPVNFYLNNISKHIQNVTRRTIL